MQTAFHLSGQRKTTYGIIWLLASLEFTKKNTDIYLGSKHDNSQNLGASVGNLLDTAGKASQEMTAHS